MAIHLYKTSTPSTRNETIDSCIPAKGKGSVVIKINLGTKITSDVLYVPDINKKLFSVGQLIEKEFKLLFEDKYCRIFDSTKQEILPIVMKGNRFSFNPTENAHKPCSTKDELAFLFTRSILDETIIYNFLSKKDC